MIKLEENRAIIEEIRSIDACVKNIKLQNIEVAKSDSKLAFNFICNNFVSDEIKGEIWNKVNNITPKGFVEIAVNVKKIVCDCEIAVKEVKAYVDKFFVSIAHMLEEGDISAIQDDQTIIFTIKSIKSNISYFEQNNVIGKIVGYLLQNYCESFKGEVVEKDGQIDSSVLDYAIGTTEVQTLNKRTIKVKNVEIIDNKEVTDIASYIEDATLVGGVTLCGKITGIKELTTKKGKPFYAFEFNDTTGTASGLYFTKKNTLDRIKRLEVEDAIICECEKSYYNEKLSLTINRINGCEFPQDFVKEEKESKKASSCYSLVFPQKYQTLEIFNFLEMEDRLPTYLTENEFVVFDIETTGLEPTSCKITEIGACKIKEGKIVETFTTLVDPQEKLSQKIIDITGITDELLKGQPLFDDVIGDFYKFCDGSTLVGHNSKNFDMKFIKHHSKKSDYYFNNNVLDTYEISKQVVKGVKDYKLNTLAEHFQVSFTHHRALSDSIATAKIFIEMIKIKGGL